MNIQYDSLLHVYQEHNHQIENIKFQYLHLLSFLTNTPMISTEEFIDKITEISKMGDILICYSIDNEKITILGSGTIIYEPKIIHGCKNVGHIEDIVVHTNYRSHGIAKDIFKPSIFIGNFYFIKI